MTEYERAIDRNKSMRSKENMVPYTWFLYIIFFSSVCRWKLFRLNTIVFCGQKHQFTKLVFWCSSTKSTDISLYFFSTFFFIYYFYCIFVLLFSSVFILKAISWLLYRFRCWNKCAKLHESSYGWNSLFSLFHFTFEIVVFAIATVTAVDANGCLAFQFQFILFANVHDTKSHKNCK